ncbi:MAG: hypothetical protein SOY06_02185 [Prevotella sp.]|nr:hypothetical protein [Bacteroidales bacterium]MDY4228647.1 hypothetical protein [Prevotella sp.]
MNKTAYRKPLIEAIRVNGNALMETWTIGVDNDPNHAIGPGDEGDIGAKQGWFGNEEDWPHPDNKIWDD